jgi:hypothetical protein
VDQGLEISPKRGIPFILPSVPNLEETPDAEAHRFGLYPGCNSWLVKRLVKPTHHPFSTRVWASLERGDFHRYVDNRKGPVPTAGGLPSPPPSGSSG